MVSGGKGNEMKPKAQDARRGTATVLAELGRQFHHRGWVLGTSGNFSAVVSSEPLRLAITRTGVDKGALTAKQIVRL